MCLSVRWFGRFVVCFACWFLVGVVWNALRAMSLCACMSCSFARCFGFHLVYFLFSNMFVGWFKRLFARLLYDLRGHSFVRSFGLRLFVLQLVSRLVV